MDIFAEKIDFELNYRLYELLEDTSYLKTAYNQIQELTDNLEPDIAAKFLSYPIPKAIVEEWEKVNIQFIPIFLFVLAVLGGFLYFVYKVLELLFN